MPRREPEPEVVELIDHRAVQVPAADAHQQLPLRQLSGRPSAPAQVRRGGGRWLLELLLHHLLHLEALRKPICGGEGGGGPGEKHGKAWNSDGSKDF